MGFISSSQISIEPLEENRSGAVPELARDIKFRSVTSRDNETLMKARHTLQPHQRIRQSRLRDYKSLPHIYRRRLVTKTETKYTHLTVGPFSVGTAFV